MDANKEKKFQELDYRIQRSCQLCKFASFRQQSNWGKCSKHTYDHLKHSDSNRHLSIYRSGVCPDFEAGVEVDIIPDAYKQLMR
jgi:hypothetical protein